MYNIPTCKLFSRITTIYIYTISKKIFFLIFLYIFYTLYIKKNNRYLTIYILISYKFCINRQPCIKFA